MSLNTGQKLLNYTIIDDLGKGSFGHVYRARDESLHCERAIKEVLREHMGDPDVRDRFIGEARAMANIHHDNVIVVHRLLTPEQDKVRDYYIVMEYMDGGSLSTVSHLINLTEAIEICSRICSALGAAHGLNIIHRDLKSDNILLSKDRRRIKVADWGCAHVPRTVGGVVNSDPSHGIRGNLAHMSPEQAAGLPLDGRSDLYAVGAMLYHLTTQRFYLDFDAIGRAAARDHRPMPPDVRAQMACLEAIQKKTPIAPRTYNPALPSALEAIILKALAKDPRQRYQSADEMIQALAQNTPTNASPAVDPNGSRVISLLEQAKSAIKLNDIAGAIVSLDRAETLLPRSAEALEELAALYSSVQQWAKAGKVLEAAASMNPSKSSIWKNLGLTYTLLEKLPEAKDALEKSRRLNPTDSSLGILLDKLRTKMVKGGL